MAEVGGDSSSFSWNQCDEEDGIIDDTDTGRTLIADQTRVLLTHHVHTELQRERIEITEEELYASGTPQGLQVLRMRQEKVDEVSKAIIIVSDELKRNSDMCRALEIVETIPLTELKKFLLDVANKVLACVGFSWSRVVVFFYIVGKAAVRFMKEKVWMVFSFCLTSLCSDQTVQVSEGLPVLRTIIEWVVSYVKENMASWIIARGGWGAIRNAVGSTTTQFRVVLTLTVVAVLFVYWRHKLN